MILEPEVYERLLETAEDVLDRAELALAREASDFVPWDQVKVDLGLM